MLYTLLVILPPLLAAVYFVFPLRVSLVLAALLAGVALLAIFHRRGHDVVTIHTLVAALIAYGIVSIIAFGSVRSTSMLAFVGAVVVGGIFLDRKILLGVVLACAAALAALIYAEASGWMAHPDLSVGPVQWAIYVAIIVAIALNVYFARSLAVEALLRAQKSENRLAALYQANPSALMTTSLPDSRIRDINRAYERMFAIEREGALGATPLELGIWCDLARRQEFLSRVSDEGRVGNLPATLRRRNGETFDALVSGEVLDMGDARHLLTTVTDISELVRTREALEASEARFSSAFRLNPIGMAVTRLSDGRYLELSDVFPNALGYTREESLDRTATELGIWPSPAARQLFLERLLAEKQLLGFETRMRNKSGELIDCLIWASLVRLGGEQCVLSSTLDVSSQKRQEAQILAMNETLEQRVAERTAELESANRELETFSYSVSHDLRAPLRAIGGFARFLADSGGVTNEAMRARARERIVAGVDRMNALIDDLIGLAQVSGQELLRQEVDLGVLAREVAGLLREDAPDRSVELDIAVQGRVRCDRALIRIVLENLFGNAWKFSAGREPAKIEFGSETQPGGETAYFVRDNGAGFDPEYADRLFSPFQRLHSEREFDGTGIGLATVRRIIARHGGRVWARSEPDKGATFYFTCGAE